MTAYETRNPNHSGRPGASYHTLGQGVNTRGNQCERYWFLETVNPHQQLFFRHWLGKLVSVWVKQETKYSEYSMFKW